MKKTILLFTAIILCVSLSAQVVPFINANNDARSAGIGNAGVALSDGAFSMYQNTASSILSTKSLAAGYSLNSLQPSFLSNTTIHTVGLMYQLNEKHAVNAGFRRYTQPEQTGSGIGGDPTGVLNSGDLIVDLGYAYSVSKRLALGANARFINSVLGGNSANAVAVDFSAHYRISNINVAASLSNVGTSLKYGENGSSNTMPAWAKAGASYGYRVNEKGMLTGAIQAAYLFSPSSFTGIEAGGGLEYLYNNMFALRAGYHFSDKSVGSSYATVGAGINFMMLSFNAAYAIAGSDNPMKNSLLISLEARF